MDLFVFEDDIVDQLWPMTLGRTAATVTCGGTRLLSRLSAVGPVKHASLRDYQSPLPGVAGPPDRATDTLLAVNSRLVPSDATVHALQALANPAKPVANSLALCRDGQLLAACLAANTQLPSSYRTGDLATWLSREMIQAPDGLSLFEYPHDVITRHPSVLDEELGRRIATGSYDEIADGVFVGRDVSLSEYVVTDSRGTDCD